MASNLPDVGLNAVIENLAGFQKGADSIAKAYEEINTGADAVENTTSVVSGAISGLGAAASTVASGGLTLLVGAIAAVGAAAVGTVASLGLMAKASFDLSSDVEASQNNIQSQLGVTAEEAEKLGEIAKQVWGNNFAGSIDEATEALITVRQQLKNLSDEELQDATENAFRLSDAFGIDITESTNAANVLMKQFGLSQQEAFDFITKGFQKGLNSSDDFLDTIKEYGNQFGDAGFSAGQMFNILDTGLQGGVLGTDKIADAVKEMNVILNEGGDEVKQAFGTIGLDFDRISGFIRSGDENWSDYFENIVGGINEIEDPMQRAQVQVAIFGTMAEDLGPSFTQSLTDAKNSLVDFSGATDTLNAQYNTLPQAFEGVKRQFLLAIQPMGDSILEAANEVIPLLFQAFEDLKPAINDFAQLMGDSVTTAVQELIPWIQGTLLPALQEFGQWIISTGLPALQDFAEFIWNDVIPVIQEFATWVGDELIPFIQDLWKLFKEGKKQGKTIEKAFDGILDAIEPLVKKVLPELLEIWDIIKKWTEKNWPLIQKIIETVMKVITAVIDTNVKMIQKIWEKWGDEITKITGFIFDTVFKMIKTTLQNILSFITTIMKIITGDWKGAWEEIQSIIKRTTDAIVSIAKSAFELMKSLIAGILEDIIKAITNKWNEAKSNTEKALNDLKNSVSNIWNQIKSNVENIVTNMINSIISKINASVSAIRAALLNMFTNAINAVASAIAFLGGIASIATNLINSLRDKIQALWSTISTGIQQAISMALNAFSISGILGAITSIASNIMNNIKAKLLTFWTLIRDGLNTAITLGINLISLPLTSLQNIGKNIIQGVIDGIEAAKDKLRSILKGVADLIPGWLADWLGIGSGAKVMRPIGANLTLGIEEGILSGIPSLMKTLQNQVAAPMVAAPALASGGVSNVTNIFNTGGNTIANNMDSAVFEQRVLQVIRNNL